MQDRVTYEYAVIRVVPKVEREEFMNVGVVLYAKRKRFIGIKYHINKDKLSAFAPNLSIDLIASYLQAWESICNGTGYIGQQDIAFRFRWLTAPKSTILQCSSIHPGLCSDPQGVLDKLFEFYVQ